MYIKVTNQRIVCIKYLHLKIKEDLRWYHSYPMIHIFLKYMYTKCSLVISITSTLSPAYIVHPSGSQIVYLFTIEHHNSYSISWGLI